MKPKYYNNVVNNPSNNGFMILAAEVVKAAIDDYKTAVKAGDKSGQKALEKWFKGKWCDALTFGCGDYVLESVQKELGIFKRSNNNAE